MFFFQTARKAAHTSIFPHDSMTRNNNGYWISASGRPGCTNGPGRAGSFSQVGIADGFSKWDERNLSPDFFLKFCAGQTQREREIFPFSRKIFLKLPRRLPKNRVLSVDLPVLTRSRNMVAADKVKSGQRGIICNQHEITDWTFENGIVPGAFLSSRRLFQVTFFDSHVSSLARTGRIARRFRSWK